MVETRTDDVVSLLRPYFGRSDLWDKRIYMCLSRVKDWQHDEALDMLTNLVSRDKLGDTGWGFLFFKDLTDTSPVGGCKILRIYLDNELRKYFQNRPESRLDDDTDICVRDQWADNVLASLHIQDELLKLQESDSEAFVDELLPWFISALDVLTIKTQGEESYPYDLGFDSLLYNNDISEAHQFAHALTRALCKVAEVRPAKFRRIASTLEAIEGVAAHRMLLKSYLSNLDEYVEDMFAYLLGDRRRWSIGYADAGHYDSAQLFGAVFKRVDGSKRRELESFLLDYWPAWERKHPKSLGYSQLPLVQRAQ